MILNFKIVKVDSKYCDYLRQFEDKVPYNAGKKELRPFIGILFVVDSFEYFAPLSSSKDKHIKLTNTMDLVKIDNGRLGVVNFNNMIPVNPTNYELFDLSTIPDNIDDLKRQNLLKAQLRWLNNNRKNVKGKAVRLYNSYKKGTLPNRIKDRCCNFILLEEKSKLYREV